MWQKRGLLDTQSLRHTSLGGSVARNSTRILTESCAQIGLSVQRAPHCRRRGEPSPAGWTRSARLSRAIAAKGRQFQRHTKVDRQIRDRLIAQLKERHLKSYGRIRGIQTQQLTDHQTAIKHTGCGGKAIGRRRMHRPNYSSALTLKGDEGCPKEQDGTFRPTGAAGRQWPRFVKLFNKQCGLAQLGNGARAFTEPRTIRRRNPQNKWFIGRLSGCGNWWSRSRLAPGKR